ncbi:MAG: DUF2157 domain-containing protein [Desulfovibrio sp.]
MTEDNNVFRPKPIPASTQLVEDLWIKNHLDDAGKSFALNQLFPVQNWGQWAMRMMLLVGTALLLAGIICFYAFNWFSLSPMAKLLPIEVLLVAGVGGAAYFSLRSTLGQVLLFVASVSVGIFMAVFGQLYQTGADSYQLFMNWALLILGWVIISRCAYQWVLWAILANLALSLGYTQLGMGDVGDSAFVLTCMLVNFCGLVLFEWLLDRKQLLWLQNDLLRNLLLGVVLLVGLLKTIATIFFEDHEAFNAIIVVMFLGVLGCGFVYYGQKIMKSTAYGLVVFSGATLVTSLIIRMITFGPSSSGDGELVRLILCGVCILIIYAIAAVLVQNMRKQKIGDENE